MDKTLLSFNLPNFVTVVLMVALGYLLFAGASQFVRGRTGGAA